MAEAGSCGARTGEGHVEAVVDGIQCVSHGAIEGVGRVGVQVIRVDGTCARADDITALLHRPSDDVDQQHLHRAVGHDHKTCDSRETGSFG